MAIFCFILFCKLLFIVICPLVHLTEHILFVFTAVWLNKYTLCKRRSSGGSENVFLVAAIKKRCDLLLRKQNKPIFTGKVTLQPEPFPNLPPWQQNCVCFVSELRQRQEMLMRNQLMAVNPQLMGPGQQRMQAIPAQFEPRLVDRYRHHFSIPALQLTMTLCVLSLRL